MDALFLTNITWFVVENLVFVVVSAVDTTPDDLYLWNLAKEDE
jgi:hypothetical protein